MVSFSSYKLNINVHIFIFGLGLEFLFTLLAIRGCFKGSNVNDDTMRDKGIIILE